MSSASAEPVTRATDRHPPGLFLLFFAEMWERFSYYGMRALLVFYLVKGFMQADDVRAYKIYGAYTALVYATPFLGGLFADKVIGARAAVVWGGILMASGHLLMTVQQEWALFGALALLICGNGFFKPNISTMVGSMYAPNSPKRDAGFTIFYMGINLGAALAPLICGYVGETYGWHYGFGLATVGMLAGLATFVAPRGVAQFLIIVAAIGTAAGLVYIGREDRIMLLVNSPLAIALLVAGFVAVRALSRGGVPEHVGRPANPAQAKAELVPGLSRRSAIYIGTILVIPLIAFLVHRSDYAGYVLSVFGGLALLSLLVAAISSVKIERERLFVVLILMFFSMLFWAFFEQAGSSVNLFTDRNVDRVVGDTPPELGTSYERVEITQEFLGQDIAGKQWTLADIEDARKERATALKADEATTVGTVSIEPTTARHQLLGIGGTELKASVFQAANPTYILLFGLVFTWLWAWLGARGLEPSTPIKFGLGLIQLGLGFGAFWWGAANADEMGMVAMSWLLLGYLLHTTGELCLSPVGLSMVTKLSPTRMVSTVMGAWFLATAFSNYLAGMIATLTGVGEGGEQTIPPPWETCGIYGNVFGKIAIAAMVSGVIVLALAPLLTRWMHMDKDDLRSSAH